MRANVIDNAKPEEKIEIHRYPATGRNLPNLVAIRLINERRASGGRASLGQHRSDGIDLLVSPFSDASAESAR